MPTHLGKKYLTTWRGRPPHMLQEDVPVWTKFIDKYSAYFKAIYYDVLVGGPSISAEEEKEPMKWMWRYNNSKRLDAVALLDKEVWIIEVASRPGLRAVGQLMTYVALWQEDDPLGLLEKPVLVCEHIDTDLIASAAKYGIQTIAMP